MFEPAADTLVASTAHEPKRLNVFERYLSLWVGLCMVAGVGLGKVVPTLMNALRGLEFKRFLIKEILQ